MKILSNYQLLLILIGLLLHQQNLVAREVASTKEITVDVCVYGATPSGILAAISVKKEGKSVVLVEPSKWVGGILGAGIKPRQDCPNVNATGGMTRPLIDHLGIRPETQKWQEIKPQHLREDFLKLLKEYNIDVIYSHRISRCGLDKEVIKHAAFDYAPFDQYGCPPEKSEKEESLIVKSKIFIDSSYDGDLMARAGVSYRVGRESTFDYNETTAGAQKPVCVTPIDPFVEPKNPASGILNLVEADDERIVGVGDHHIQAYNYRYYVTSDPKYKVEITCPENYDPMDYELVGRYVKYLTEEISDTTELLKSLSGIFPGWMNAKEYNYHRDFLFTMAPIGVSHRYALGDYATKSNLWKYHRDYLRGLHHFMSTDKRVPEEFRKKTAKLGLDRRPHEETNGWPHQLYLRVTRRLVGNYTITEHDVYNKTTINDPIGLAQYGIDIYPLRRVWFKEKGKYYLGLEGPMFVGGAKGPTDVPYPIPYRAITPLKQECANLIVPICFSATHVGYASARMEPVFMICGESAGIAAVQALNEGVSVQDINMNNYIQKLKDAKQILSADDIQK